MYIQQALAALLGLVSIATSAPASSPAEEGVKPRVRFDKRAPLVIQQTIVEQTIVLVQQNLDTINNLVLLAEQQFAALIQSQVALIQTVEAIKNNIRINHFKARFSTVNTVIVTVTRVVDVRDSANINTRYLVNQLLADNGHADKEVVVMVTADSDMTIGLPSPTIDLGGILASASAVTQPTSVPNIAAFDPLNPFGLFNQSVLLPYNSSAPTLAHVAQLFPDPASIILPGAQGHAFFVQDLALFNQDCALWGANSQSLFNLQDLLVLSAQQRVAQQLAGLQVGAGISPALAAQLLQKAALAPGHPAASAAEGKETGMSHD